MIDNQLKNFHEELRRYILKKGLSEREFASSLKMTPSQLNGYVQGKTVPSPRIMNRILAKYPDAPSPYGRMEQNESKNNIMDHPGIPFYDISVTEMSDMILGKVSPKPSFYINMPPLQDCDFAIRHNDKSMTPDLNIGDIIALKRVINPHHLLYGDPYLILTKDKDFRAVRNVRRMTSSDSQLLLVPVNEKEFDSSVMDLDDIAGYFHVRAKIQVK